MATEALSTMVAAQKCGVHYTTIRRWVIAGQLPTYQTPGGHLRIFRKDVDSFIASRRFNPAASVGGNRLGLRYAKEAPLARGTLYIIMRSRTEPA